MRRYVKLEYFFTYTLLRNLTPSIGQFCIKAKRNLEENVLNTKYMFLAYICSTKCEKMEFLRHYFIMCSTKGQVTHFINNMLLTMKLPIFLC